MKQILSLMDDELIIFLRSINIDKIEQFIFMKLTSEKEPIVSVKLTSIDHNFRYEDINDIEQICIRFSVFTKLSDNSKSRSLQQMFISLNRLQPSEIQIKKYLNSVCEFLTEYEFKKIYTFLKLVEEVTFKNLKFPESIYNTDISNIKKEIEIIKDFLDCIVLIDFDEKEASQVNYNRSISEFEESNEEDYNYRYSEEESYCAICQESPCRCSDFDPE